MSNLISVVVPIYNVEPYLKSCLDSVVAQARTCSLDVILVDDGSTDASALIAAQYANRHSYIRLIRQQNGGLGHARNVGAGHARGDYLIFLDSDDVLPDGTYAAMREALDDQRVDFVTGNVVRLSRQITTPSGAHQKSHSMDCAATHIREHLGLLWDTTAWNKMFRRRFWEDRRLAFPEGVLYEDMELMTRSHLLARQVAVLTRTCYLWRIRTEWPPSITQCRTNLQNIDDRFTAIFALFETLERLGTPALRAAYQHKVVSLDMPIYVRQYGRDDSDQYRGRLQAYVQRALQQCAPDIVDRASSADRLKYWLIANGRADEVAAVNRCQDTHFDTCPLTIRHSRVLRTYSGLNADRPEVPGAVMDVTGELSPHTCVYDVRSEGRTLVMDVHAFVPGISPVASGAMARRFHLRNPGSDRRIDLEARPWPARAPTAMLRRLHFDGVWSRATLILPVDTFIEQTAADSLAALWEVWVDCELAGLVWSDRVRRRDGEYMDRERYVDCDGRRVRACLSRDEQLQIVVEPLVAYVVDGAGVVRLKPDGADLEPTARGAAAAIPLETDLSSMAAGADVAFGIAVHGDATGGLAFTLHGDHGPVDEWPLASRAPDGSWTVSRARVTAAMERARLSRSVVGIRLERAAHRVIVPAAFEREWSTPEGHVFHMAGNADGHLMVARWQHAIRITDLSLREDGLLRVALDAAPPAEVGSDVSLELVDRESGRRLPMRRVVSVDPRRHEIDLAHIDRWSMQTVISLGEWRIVARREDMDSPEPELPVVARLRHSLRVQCRSNGVCALIRVNDAGNVVLRVTTDWPEHADLHAKRRTLETSHYPQIRRRPVTQSVVFDSWGGTAFSDGPRRLYEELARRVPGAQLVWIVRDPSVWTPEGVNRVLRGTTDYFDALGSARYVVTNARLPEHFEKRDDCTYVRLSRGIPVKRIGMDVTGVASLAASNVQKLAADAKRWDLLVSGHPYASCIFRRAFAYDGAALDAGQPRLDGLVSPDATARRERVRSRLGIRSCERVLLYAPTWRDHLFAKRGRYVMPRGLAIGALLDELGTGWRLLLKNHPFVSDRTGDRLDPRVVNASAYAEMTDVYLAADVLVTDYSSAMFDFAVTGKPILVFAPDLDEFRERVRGVYWDMDTDAPGPVLRTTGDLIEQLRELPAVEAQWRTRYREFNQRFCSLEDGRATQRVVEAVFAEWLD